MAPRIDPKKIKAFLSNKAVIAIGLVFALIALYVMLRSTGNSESDVYRIAVSEEWHQAHLHGKEKNFLGFINDLMAEIAQNEHLKFQIVVTAGNNVLNGLHLNQYDAMVSGMVPELETKNRYLFSNVIYLTGPLLIVRSDATIKSLAEMSNKRVGILTGSSVVFKLEHYPAVSFTSYNNVMDALIDLERNTIDGVIIDAILAQNYISTLFAGKLKVVSTTLTDEGIRLIANKNPREQELITRFNNGLKTLQENGTYDTLLRKWRLFTIPL